MPYNTNHINHINYFLQWGITFKVYFENIAINEIYELTAGKVHVDLPAVTLVEAGTQGAQAYIDSFEDDLDATDSLPADNDDPIDTDTGTDIPQDTISIDGTIDSVYVNPNTGDIIILTDDGTETTYTQEVNPETGEKETTLITDSDGNSWVVDGDGNVSKNIDESFTGSITSDSSYPFRQFLILGYNKDISKDQWFYCNTKALSTNHKPIFEKKVIKLRKGYSGVTYDQLNFDTDCEVNYDPEMTIRAEYISQLSANTKLVIAKWSDKYFVKWLLNGLEISNPNDIEDKLNIGANTLELQVKPQTSGSYTSYAVLTINYATTDLSQFRVRVYRNGEEKLYENYQTIGDVDEGEKILNMDETIKLELLQRDKQGEWKMVSEPVWEIRDNKYDESVFELQLQELMSQVTVIKRDLMAEELRINLDVKRQEEEINLPENNFANINVTALTNLSNTKRNKRKEKYARALEKIKIKSANLYDRFSNSIPSLQVYIVPKTHDKIPAVDDDERLNGLANAQILQTPGTYELLDILYKTSDLDKNIIKNTAKLVRKLSDGQKNQIRIASEKHEMTNMFKELYVRIKMDDWELAEALKDKTMAGEYDESFIQHIRYEVKPEEANDYITIGASQMEIYLNDNAVGTDQSLMTRTLAHELKHLEFAFLHPYIKLKWMILRDKNPNYPDYKLGDKLGHNGHCSAGEGHEMYNPENEEVCDEEKEY